MFFYYILTVLLILMLVCIFPELHSLQICEFLYFYGVVSMTMLFSFFLLLQKFASGCQTIFCVCVCDSVQKHI